MTACQTLICTTQAADSPSNSNHIRSLKEENAMSRIGTVWSPWREMNRLRREMDHLMHYEWAPLARGTSAFPPVNLWENEKGLVLTAEVPGLDASQLDVSLEKESLTISGGRAG